MTDKEILEAMRQMVKVTIKLANDAKADAVGKLSSDGKTFKRVIDCEEAYGIAIAEGLLFVSTYQGGRPQSRFTSCLITARWRLWQMGWRATATILRWWLCLIEIAGRLYRRPHRV